MPSTLSGLLVILFAILPGVPANNIYQRLVGVTRKEEQWSAIVRMIGFSLGGLIFYVIIGKFINAPLPAYISPNTFANLVVDRATLFGISLSLTGHFIASALISIAISYIVLLLDLIGGKTLYQDTWDKFASTYVDNRWVVVKLTNGDTYLGILGRADINVDKIERDIILKEPSVYLAENENYLATNYQFLFLSGSMIESIGAMPNFTDTRIIPVGSFVFSQTSKDKESKNERRKKG
ncbi:hypothetical protein FBQ81_07680 [Chloroflexi bacterium CFX6]|nr:hypothetical protein [Chloroflexi bacterium CFX6]